MMDKTETDSFQSTIEIIDQALEKLAQPNVQDADAMRALIDDLLAMVPFGLNPRQQAQLESRRQKFAGLVKQL